MQLNLIDLSKQKKWSTIVNHLDTVANTLSIVANVLAQISVPIEDGSQQ
jgi:hypothetical protein